MILKMILQIAEIPKNTANKIFNTNIDTLHK